MTDRGPGPSRAPARVLLFEDSPTQAQRFAGLLEAAGHEVTVASDGDEGLRWLALEPFDVVLSDVVMPGMSGHDVCRTIKARPATAHLPVVLLTMLDDPQEILRALECGADAYLTKSHAPEYLVRRVDEVLARAAVGGGGEVRFLDQRLEVDPGDPRLLHLLIGTFEEHVRTNRELEASLRRLAAQNAALMRAEGLRRDLSALVVHDLKSPTSGLLMLAQSQLRRPALAEADRVRWASVHASAELLQRMIMNLLDVSRSEDGVLAPDLGPVDVLALVASAREVLEFQLEDRRQAVEVRVVGEPRAVVADADLLGRVLLNLLDNASRYSPSGGRIEVEVRFGEGALEVRVRNEGASIPAALRHRIFEKYVRLDPAAGSAAEPGRGLGLSFCRMAAEAHGGAIRVEDGEPGAVVFCVSIPLDGPPPRPARP
jgi:two-component system sensor histidine kinase/response regulator